MAKSIQQILHHKNFIGVIQSVKGGIPSDIIPSKMLNPTKKIRGNKGSYKKVTSTREVAQLVHYGAASKNVKLSGVQEVPIVLLHSFEHFYHEPDTVMLLTSLNEQDQLMGAEEVGRVTADFGLRYANLRLAAVYSALFKGMIFIGNEGNLLASSSGTAITVDFGIPAGNKSQLNWDGKGDIISAKWSSVDTDIPKQITNIQIAAAIQSGYKIKNAFYGKNVPSYVAKNTAMQEFLKFHPSSNETIRNGGIPNGFQNLDWYPASSAFFTDITGTTQFFVGDDDIIFTPDINDAGWWGMIEGSYPVPTDLNIKSNAAEALNSLQNVNGMFSYAKVSDDPVTIQQFNGDTFLPTINVPKSIYIATVHWS